MKKILRKSALIGLFYYLLILINACCNCKDYQKPWYFNLEAINASNCEFQIEGDTSFRIFPSSADTIGKEKFGIIINLDAKRIASFKKSDALNFSSAYACKCDIDNQFLTDSITEIHIKTLVDFDATHLSKANVDEYFSYLETKYNATKNYIEYTPLSKIIYERRPQQSINLFLINKPTLSQKVLFEVQLKTIKGKFYYDTTSAVILY